LRRFPVRRPTERRIHRHNPPPAMRPSRPGKTGSHLNHLREQAACSPPRTQPQQGIKSLLRLRPLPSPFLPFRLIRPARHPRPHPSSFIIVRRSPRNSRLREEKTPSLAHLPPSASSPPRIRRRRCLPFPQSTHTIPGSLPFRSLNFFLGNFATLFPAASINLQTGNTKSASVVQTVHFPHLCRCQRSSLIPRSLSEASTRRSREPLSGGQALFPFFARRKKSHRSATSSTVGCRPIGIRASRSFRAPLPSTPPIFSSCSRFTTFT